MFQNSRIPFGALVPCFHSLFLSGGFHVGINGVETLNNSEKHAYLKLGGTGISSIVESRDSCSGFCIRFVSGICPHQLFIHQSLQDVRYIHSTHLHNRPRHSVNICMLRYESATTLMISEKFHQGHSVYPVKLMVQ